MPANIQTIPVFQPYTFDQYIAPLNLYKQEYDRVEQEYNTLAETASVLEKLRADAPNSQAYRQYLNYMDDLQAEADYLAYNGLTSGHRRNLNHIRQRYGKELLPIMTAVSEWEKDKTRYDNLKDGEIMSFNPYNKSVDNYLGYNPSARTLDLERVRKDAQLTGQSWSQRLYGDLSPFVLDGIYGGIELLQQLQGFVHDGPDGQNSLEELKKAASVLQAGGDDERSEGIMTLVHQLDALGYDTFDQTGQKQILNSMIMGYSQGLEGTYNYRNSPFGGSSGGSGFGTSVDYPPTKYSLIPLVNDDSQQAIDNITTLGGVQNSESGEWRLNENNLKFAIAYTSPEVRQGTDIVPLSYLITPNVYNDIINNQDFNRPNMVAPLPDGFIPSQGDTTSWEDRLLMSNRSYADNRLVLTQQNRDRFNNILNTLNIYRPDVVEQIKNGEYNGDINQVIRDVIADMQNTDKGVKLYNMTFNDQNDVIDLKSSLIRHAESNGNTLATYALSGDGKTFVDGADISLTDVINGDKKLDVYGIDFLATDPNNIIVNCKIDGAQKRIKLPINTLSAQAGEALSNFTQVSTDWNAFESQHGKYSEPSPNATTRTDMEEVYVADKQVEQELLQLPYQDRTGVRAIMLLKEKLQTLARQKGKEDVNYYWNLYNQYQHLDRQSQYMYRKFVNEFGYGTNVINYDPTKVSTSRQTNI